MLQFDAETARILDDGYQGGDIQRRRLANIAGLAPERGDAIADIGAGTGLLALDLSRAVGDDGTVVAIDPSREMRAATATRCAGRGNVRILEGTAGALPLDDASIERAVSLQVFEYLEDIPAALTEIRRVLRPGGRLAIGDLHWDSHVWHADDTARMDRMLRIWDRHLTHRDTPALLPPLLRAAGFTVEAVLPELCHDTTFRADGLAMLMIHLIRAYAGQNRLATEDEIDAWADEQRRMAEAGRFFFAITHYVVVASRNHSAP
jgi:arsenite methyltransferase